MSDDSDYDDYESEGSSDDYHSPVKKTKASTTTKKPAATTKKAAAKTKKATEPKKPSAPGSKKRAASKKKADSEDEDMVMDDLDDLDDEDSPPPKKKTNEENVFENIAKSVKSGKTIEEIYQKKELLDQILLRPDTYIGSIEMQDEELWVWGGSKMEKRKISFVPGIYKIFDEILVNAADNKQKDAKGCVMKYIKVDIDATAGSVTISNDGHGIPVVKHKEHKIYVPELIFGNLLTSSNYDDSEERLTGGRNGFGAKLANIFSNKFIVEVGDSENGKLFKQTFTKNMKQKEDPVITSYSKSTNYTTITFFPELKRFGMTHFDDDLMALLEKRVYDIAGTNAGLKVSYNGKNISFSSFEKYIELYIDNNDEENPIKVHYEKVSDRWEIAIALSTEGQFNQVSFVNSICTTKGGTHVTHALQNIISAISEKVKKASKTADLRAQTIKNYLFVFVKSMIINPQFDSQTKESLTTKKDKLGSTCEPSEKFIKKVCDPKTGIVSSIVDYVKLMDQNKFIKKFSGKKTGRPYFPKLDDANLAGSKSSADCTLILTEGDSAKSIATAGISVVGRDLYGAFPLKGKIENVSDLSNSKVVANEEITAIVEIMGLQYGKEYTSVDTLRYGHLMIMTDQDHDGSHIKGLLINLIKHFWPSLLQIPGFLVEFITPIVKCFKKGQKTLSFYTLPEFLEWKEKNPGKGWHIKYYKGLGTSKPEEGKEYFAAIDKHKIDFEWDSEAEENIDKAFNKKRADDRKKWMAEHVDGTFLEQYGTKTLKYSDFINKELVLFSIADCDRSIPSLVDGLKTSLRKILFSCFKRNLKSEIRVAQLIGYVSEQSAYHHGEMSLNKAIVGMAQDYVGSNNINLLYPSGSFGSRYEGGEDCSSARYIHTRLQSIARAIYHPDDDHILKTVIDDGIKVEPKFYVPIIPMVLVNGGTGIGTGWSSKFLSYNPRDIIKNIKLHLDGKEMKKLTPFTRGFTGTIENGKGDAQYVFNGVWKKLSEYQFEITELPVGVWTQDYKEYLEELLNPGTKEKRKQAKAKLKKTTAKKTTKATSKKKKDDNEEKAAVISKYVNYSSEAIVHFIVTTVEPVDNINIPKEFKLTSTGSETNMVVFDEENNIVKYNTTMEIMDNFLKIRMKHYDMRKEFLCEKLLEEYNRLSNKARFILAVVNKEIEINKVKKVDILKRLKEMKFDKILKNANQSTRKKLKAKSGKNFEEEDAIESDNEEERDEDEMEVDQDEDSKGYDYLLSLPLWSLTLERVKKIMEERDTKKQELDKLKSTPIKEIYLRDLEVLEEELDKQDEYDTDQKNLTDQLKSKHKGKKLPKARKITTIRKSKVAKPPSSTSKAASKSTLGKRKKEESDIEEEVVVEEKKPSKPAATVSTKSSAVSTSASSKIDSYFTKLSPKTSSTTTSTTISSDSDEDYVEKPTTKKSKTTVAAAKPIPAVIPKPSKPSAKASTTNGKKKVLTKKEESFSEDEDSGSDTPPPKNIVLPSLRTRGAALNNIPSTFFDSSDDEMFSD
ncbi:DNA topoisomerase II [Tieghemostelium lacteum]|uniref:DNA topoisomerase 2 n=1 Tax=Tieghemostelium lacteum TaxID=361077 RepID=A0A151Z7T4_TIELA|nr:DNA topoisomerase II [Tieghemostelium lacteum]|eukprot:KYQ90029.1 DNA topoisomerase II [Tieghemostelium lacteum]